MTPFGTDIGFFPILERLLFRAVVERPDSIVKVVRMVVRGVDFETVGVPTNPLVRWLSIIPVICIVARTEVWGKNAFRNLFYPAALFPSFSLHFFLFFSSGGKKTKIRERSERERKRETALAGATKKRIRDVIVSTIATKIRRHESWGNKWTNKMRVWSACTRIRTQS